MTEPKRPARRAATEGKPAHEYDPETGRFLDGPHPEDYTDEEPEPAPKSAPKEEGKPE